MEFRDYYTTLGVERSASADEIKRAYRKLARKYHPDVSKEADAEERFKEVNEAYEVLKDSEKRSAYDQFGEHWQAGQDFQPPPDWQQEFGFRPESFAGSTAGFSDFFDSLFGGRSGGGGFDGGFHRDMRMDGQDINANISISLEEAFHGGTRQINLDVPTTDDQGHRSVRRRKLNVKIPKGIKAGQRIRLEHQGGQGHGAGAQAGDLYLNVSFTRHPIFTANGADVEMELPITPSEAALGHSVKTPTLGGVVDLKIPPGSSSGRRLRLAGRGLPGSPAGDQYVVLKIVLPQPLSEQARSLYEQLDRLDDINPRESLGV
jgi:curved DNA-binding protein